MTKPVPDLKPHVPPLAPGTECCDCCDGIAAETPQGIDNRGGLSAIAYRIGRHPQFRASLQAALSSSAFPALGALRTRDNDDFTIGLIDAFACSADVVTFYQERIANESWLRTAVERVSLQEMGKLVGYRLRPGVAAETWLAFALDTPPVPPATLAPEPGNFVTGVPASLALEIGTRVQSVPGPGEKPQSFELVETLADTRAAWNAMTPWLAEAHLPARGERQAWLAGVATNLKPGDALLFVGGEFFADATSDAWDFRLVTAVEPDSANDRTRVAWARGLGASDPFSNPPAQPGVFALRKRSAVFGNNAPVWRSMDPRFRAGYAAKFGGSSTADEWRNFTITPASPSATAGAVDLDQVQSEIAADVPGDIARRSFAVLAKGGFNRRDENFPSGTYVELYRVTATTEVSRAEFALSAKVTRLDLAGENLNVFFASPRETSVYARSELMPLAQRPVTTAVGGDRIPVAVAADGLVAGRRLVVRGVRTSDGQPVVVQATLVAAHAVDAGRCELEISPPLADALRRDSVVVHGNVALASHGESVSQVLGAGNASQPFQKFELKQLPLTWRAAANELGAAAELTVRVGGVAWKERTTLYGAAPTDRAFTLSTDEQGRMFVGFGDGLRGARLPSGTNNVQAAYRKGLGIEGNVAAGSLTQLMTRPLGLKSVSNPLAAEGGTDPEPASDARRSIPLTTRTLGRAVSVLDYEDFARAYSGIAKARAGVLQVSGIRTVAITLAAPLGKPLTPASPVWTNLLGALKASGDPHVPVTLLSLQQSTFRLGLRVKCDPDFESAKVLASVEAALRDHFSFDVREPGQPVQQSDVIATAQAVPGVVAVDLTRLYGGTQPLQQTVPSLQVRLLASRQRVEGGIARAAELLTLDPAPFDDLEVMA
ncbi:putative baseplate assembly protein [Reyranella sp.]|uniref:putative baseplate assembly protein n=1 Tax=Reyranella sp. TaxID=1929291 RepID=UPI003BA8E3D0